MAAARFQDRHVVLSGAGTGIGRAIALRLAREGARLSLFARDLARLETTAREARELGAPAVIVQSCDVRDAAAVERTLARFAAEQGPFFAAVANSGIAGPNRATAGRDSGDRFTDIVRTNLMGTYATFVAARAHLAPGPEARHLVAIGSILARIGVPAYTGYCASKAGVLGLVRSLAAELAPENVQVNAVCPGWVDTDMARQGLEVMAREFHMGLDDVRAMMMKQVPLGRMSAPEDVAGVVAWLLSADARGVTGQGVDVNGGAFMH